MKRILFIDIGQVNFAFYIEEYNEKELFREISFSYKTKISRKNNIEKIRNICYKNGKFVNIFVLSVQDKDSFVETRKNLFSYLQSNYKEFKTCDVVRIEQQFVSNFGKSKFEMNMKAIQLAECTFSWFYLFFPEKDIDFFPSRLKTEKLGCEKMKKKKDRKKWCEMKAEEIFSLRNDDKALKLLNEFKENGQKLDDMCDCCCMAQALSLIHI